MLFVLVLGASNLTYVEPVLRQDLAAWIACHVHAFAYSGLDRHPQTGQSSTGQNPNEVGGVETGS